MVDPVDILELEREGSLLVAGLGERRPAPEEAESVGTEEAKGTPAVFDRTARTVPILLFSPPHPFKDSISACNVW